MLDSSRARLSCHRMPQYRSQLGMSEVSIPCSPCGGAPHFAHLTAEGLATAGYRLTGYVAEAGSLAASRLSFCKLTKPHTKVLSGITPQASETSGLYVPMSLWAISHAWKCSGNFWEQHCQAWPGSSGDLYSSAVNIKEIHPYQHSKY